MTTRSRDDDLETTKNTLVSTSENVANSCPTFPESPALPWFGHLIPEDGIVDAVDVKISWNQIYIGDDEGVISGSFRIKDVAVIYHPIRLLTDPDHPLIKRINCFDDRHFRCTHGNVWSDWKDEDLKAATWKIWDDLCYVGFLNDNEAKRARMEFARIRECEWARDVGFEIPKGVPWTDDDWQALAPARKQMRKWKEQRDELGLPEIKTGQINKAPPVGSSHHV